MKKLAVVLAVLTLCVLATTSSFAQASANQTVTMAVQPVYRIAVSGDPGTLTISGGTEGVDALTPATDASTSYRITQNVGNTVKITAHMDAVMDAGYSLGVQLASTRGTSAGNVNISNATSASAADVVTAINRGADAGQVITYTFGATAAAGATAANIVRTVTLTLTN